MNSVVALSHHTGLRLAEVGFLLMIVAGIALAAGGVLLIIATHWGHFS